MGLSIDEKRKRQIKDELRRQKFKKIIKNNPEFLYSLRKKEIVKFIRRRGIHSVLASQISIVDLAEILNGGDISRITKTLESLNYILLVPKFIVEDNEGEPVCDYGMVERVRYRKPETFFKRFKEWCEEIHHVEFNSKGTVIESVLKLLMQTKEGLNLPSITKYGDYDILTGSSSPIPKDLIPMGELHNLFKIERFINTGNIVTTYPREYILEVCRCKEDKLISNSFYYSIIVRRKMLVVYLCCPDSILKYKEDMDSDSVLKEINKLRRSNVDIIYTDLGLGLKLQLKSKDKLIMTPGGVIGYEQGHKGPHKSQLGR